MNLVENIKGAFDSFVRFLRSSRRTTLLMIIAVLIIIVIGTMVPMWLNKIRNFHVSSLGTIKTLGVEAYWDRDLENKTEIIYWETIHPGLSKNVTLYLQSISNVETTLYLNSTNWNPANISNYMNLSWNYNGTTIHPSEIIQVTLTLSASYSNAFLLYLITNDVKEFSFEIIIGTQEMEN